MGCAPRWITPTLLLSILSVSVSGRTLELQASRTSAADVTLTSDGKRIVFTTLGHLFALSSPGGTAEQLTFGPYYDSDPVFSPDGSRLAFTSDRDGSEGNIFLLTLEGHNLVQLTHEEHAGRATWSPDGKSIIYLRYARWTSAEMPSVVSRISVQGGQPEILNTPARHIGSTFYLPDGRLAWSVIEQEKVSSEYTTRIEVLGSQGAATTFRTMPGTIDRVLASSDGLYCHREIGADLWVPTTEDIIFVPTSGGPEKEVTPVSSLGRFALSADSKYLYLGDEGRLWKVSLPAGGRQPVSFRAHVKVEIQDIISKPSRSSPQEGNAPRAISTPILSPDGNTLVFGAAGYLWRQRLDGGKAQRISQDSTLELSPAFSPDGRQLAFVHSTRGEDSVFLLDMGTGHTRLLTSGPSISELAWSADGQRIVALVAVTPFEQHVTAFSVADGKPEQLADAGSWSPRPQFSADGHVLYYSAASNGIGNLYRLALSKDAKPEQISHFSRHLSAARISQDGKWLAFRRNHSILAAPLSDSIQDADVHEVATEGGESFALTPNGTSVIYAVGRHVWRQPLAGGARQEIPLTLEMRRALPPPVLLRGVRVLDLASGTFGMPTSMLLENGKITWIGNEQGNDIPQRAIIVDAGGRFAIPGLFDIHVHSVGANEEAFLAYGVTSLRDTGGALAFLNVLQDRSELTDLPLPRYFYSGEIFEGPRPYWGDSFLQIDNEQDARDYVRRFKQSGASFIKVYPSLPWSLQRIVADEARRVELPVVGHGISHEEIIKGITLGFFSLEHAPSSPNFDDVLQMLAAAGTHWDPTLVVMDGNSLLLRDEPEKLTDSKFKTYTPSSYIDFAMSAGYNKALGTDSLRGNFSALLASVGNAHKLGVKLLVGTDAPNPEVFYGSSLHWELQRFVEAGLSPWEALRLATEAAASAVGADDLGTIAPGKLADIVLLQANPIENIHNTETIWRVIKAGRIFDPAKLHQAIIEAPTKN
jgi:Tol biopolymer transport system component/imidazolonepropionase-like amidohydrolase